ncbi:MAG: hypothetical protein U0744_13480 [Gemmataceae bacterium]
MQIVTLAVLIGGVAILATFYVWAGNGLGPNDVPVLSYLAAGLLALQSIVAWVLPRTMVDKALPQIAAQPSAQDESRLFNLRQATHILAVALLESAVIFAAVAYRQECQAWALMVAIAGIISDRSETSDTSGHRSLDRPA